jgi:nucleotide-binding universal stress UspA family protein
MLFPAQEDEIVTFKKILFPTDFSANADRALAHAIRLAEFEHGELIVQHVVEDYFDRHPHWSTLFDIHETQKLMDMHVSGYKTKTLPQGTNDVKLRTVISKGKPAEEIRALAEKEMVDLIVMGSAKGVITNQVIRLSNRPVLAISENGTAAKTKAHKINSIVVATDFSEHSNRVVRYAFDLKRLFDASLYLLYVIETPSLIDFGIRQGHFTETLNKMREWATNQLLNLTPDEFVNDPRVLCIVEEGSASARIAEVAAAMGADLTIVGTHEHGAIHQRLLGTTTDRLLTKTETPVLAVKI